MFALCCPYGSLCVEQVYGVQQHHESRNCFGELTVGCEGEVLKARALLPWPVLLKNLLPFGETLCKGRV